MNKAYLLKLGWKLKIGDKSLWGQVMREKYDGWSAMNDMDFFAIGNGKKANVLTDCWVQPGITLNNLRSAITNDQHVEIVVDLMNGNGDWKMG